MNAISKAIQTGLEKAQLASRNVDEIFEVLADIQVEIETETSGRLTMEFRQSALEKTVLPLQEFVSNKLLGTLTPASGSSNHILMIVNPVTSKEAAIASLQMSETGYPCALTFDRKRTTCWQKQELLDVVLDMLASPTTGKAILLLMDEGQPTEKD